MGQTRYPSDGIMLSGRLHWACSTRASLPRGPIWSVALHPPVLVLLEAITVLQCGILLYIARDRRPGIDPITWWSIGMAVGSVGLVLLIVPGSRFVNHELPVTLVILAAGFAWVAARNFAGRSAHWAIVAAGPVVWLLANRIPGIADAEGLGIGLSWGIGAFYQLAFVAALWPNGKEYLPARTAMLIFVGTHAAIYALRAALGVTDLDLAFRDTLTGVLLLEGQFRVIGTAFLVLALTKQRAELTTARSLEAAQRASAARSRFVAQMSHELRTPLNGVFGLAQVLMRDPRLLSDQRAHVQALEIAGRHLLSIVNDALDLAKIDADRLEFIARPLDPVATAAECVALLRSAAVEKGIALRLELDRFMPKLILGDQTRLQQILLNLLSNAVKFTPDGGSVTLHVVGVPANLLAAGMPSPGVPLGGGAAVGGAAAGGSLGGGESGGGQSVGVQPGGVQALGVRFDVIDTGPGVPPEQRHLLFRDFTQLDPSGGEGSGLGLAISARLAERMGGSLRYLRREDGPGSVFRLALPWPEAPAEPAMLCGGAEPAASGLDLLVADDIRVNRMVLRAMLTGAGHRVTEANGGREVLALVAEHRFDMILLDLRMPDMDGMEVTARLRAAAGWTAEVPIVGISADVMPGTVEACVAGGMDVVLPKPVEFDALLAELDRLRTHRHTARAEDSEIRALP